MSTTNINTHIPKPPEFNDPQSISNILERAHKIIYGDREATYGSPTKNLDNIAAYWSVHLSAVTNTKITLTSTDVCVMMILLKQARLANTPNHLDSVIDTAGYAALIERISPLV